MTAAKFGGQSSYYKSEAAAFLTVNLGSRATVYLQCHSAMVVSPVDGRKRGFKRMIILVYQISFEVVGYGVDEEYYYTTTIG